MKKFMSVVLVVIMLLTMLPPPNPVLAATDDIRVSHSILQVGRTAATQEETQTATVRFTLNGVSAEPVSFHYSVKSGSADASRHLTGVTTGTVSFAAGETAKTVTIGVAPFANNPGNFGTANNKDAFWTGERFVYLYCDAIVNALFAENRYSLTIPVPIQSLFDFEASYDNAVHASLIDLNEVDGEIVPGIYEMAAGSTLTLTAGISGDVRTMLDAGVLTHIRMPEGYFLHETGTAGTIGSSLKTYRELDDVSLPSDPSWFIDVSPAGQTSFHPSDFPQTQPVADVPLGPLVEANGIFKRLDFIFKNSSVPSTSVKTCFLDAEGHYQQHQVSFYDDEAPHVNDVQIGMSGDIHYGDFIPVVVSFSEPVRTAGITMEIEGILLQPMESSTTISNAVSFLYEVGDDSVGNTHAVVTVDNITGAVDLSGKNQAASESRTATAPLSAFDSANPERTLAYCAQPAVTLNQGTSRNAEATISIPVKRDGSLSNWLLARKDANDVSTAVKARAIGSSGSPIDVPLTIHTDGLGVTELTGTFTAPENKTGSDVMHAMELHLDSNGDSVFSPVRSLTTTYAVPPLVLVDDADDITLGYAYWPSEDTVYADAGGALSLGHTLNVDATWQESAYFSWSSSNVSVATINAAGIITLTGTAGTVSFTLTVSNPLSEPSVVVTSRALTVRAAENPFLYIPDGLKNLEILRGNSARISFVTNLIERNRLYFEENTETEFTCTLYEAVYTDAIMSKGPVLSSETVRATTQQPISGYTAPSGLLQTSTEKGTYGYILEISAPDLHSGLPRTAEANIRVRDLPAKAVLVRPEVQYLTDSAGSFEVLYDIVNRSAGTAHLLSVVRNSQPVPVFSTTAPSDIGRSLSVEIPAVEGSRLLDVYTVTLKTKNPLDEAWSYDSYLLYVYNDNALKLLVDGFPNPHNLTMKADFTDGVVAWYTDIFWYTVDTGLQHNVSINRNEYAWSTIADKVTWSVEGESVSLWYASGGTRQRIDTDTGTLLLPGTGLTLRADEAGHSVVTATHALTGMSDSLTVNVEPVHDKLFLFQSYPAMICNIRYKNGNGVERSYTTTALGQLTVYESSGIASDVLFYPTGDNAQIYHYGVLTNGRMTATQNTADRFDRYPKNTVLLPQRNHRVTLSFLENGTGAPYTGPVILRGGLYLNDQYMSTTTINNHAGNADQTVTPGADGRYTLNLLAAGVTDNHELAPEDRIAYVLEVRFPDHSHIPMFLKVDDLAVWENRASPMGVSLQQSIRPLDAHSIQNSVIVLSESLVVNGKDMSLENLNYIDEVPRSASLSMEMIVPGGYRPSYQVGLVDETDTVRSTTNIERSETYPFAEMAILGGTANMSGGLTDILRYYMDPGSKFNLYPVVTATGLEIRLSTPIQIRNLMGVPSMSAGLDDSFNDTVAMFDNIHSEGGYDVDSGLVGDALDFMTNYDMSFGQSAGLEIIPTDDPLVYKGIFRLTVGTYDRDNPSGIFVASGNKREFRYMPGFSDMRAMQKGVFLQKSKATMNKFKDHSKGFYYSYGGGAYVECEIFYDVGRKEWMMRLLTSDTYLGGGGGYRYIINGSIGPVPVTATLKAGMTATLGLKIVNDAEENTTTYVTYLYPGVNLYAFGGIGADYDVVAFKAGAYGMIEHNQEYYWVNNNERNGQLFSISGETGIQFTAKLTFIEYNAKWKWGGFYDSWAYGDWGGIYWDYFVPKEVKKALFRGWPRDEVDDLGMTFEDRAYLSSEDRAWVSGAPEMRAFGAEEEGVLLLEDAGSGITDLWANAYPHANPSMTDDGELLVYLSDMDSTDLMDTAANFSLKSGGVFPAGMEIDTSDSSDSALSLSGTKEAAAAVWNRTFDSFNIDTGDAATTEDLIKALSATEVMAGVFNGTAFTTTRLTDNDTPDLSPVVASHGNKAIAAWRSVTLGDMENLLDFTSDSLLYSVYNGTAWSAAQTLHDGSVDHVNALSAAMLPDGTSAIVYQFTEADGGDTEIACAVLDATGNVAGTLRLTDNHDADVAPQITTALFPDDIRRFVIGWNGVNDSEESIFRLSALNAGGTAYPAFDLELTGDMGSTGNARFTKGADKIEDLSLVWVESDLESAYAFDGSRRDVLWGRKLVKAADGTISASGRLKLQALDAYTTVDSFDPHVNPATGQITTALLLSEHGAAEAGKTAIMATAVVDYQNALTVAAPDFAYEDVLPGLDMPIVFTVTNDGVEPISTLTLLLGGVTHTFADQNIAPGETASLTVLHEVPTPVTDAGYTLTAHYASLPDESHGGSLKLSLPDAGIHSIDLTRENLRERSFHVLMENSAHGKLVPGTHTVRLEVYDTPDYRSPGFTGTPIHTVDIADAESLEKLNESLLSVNVTLDAGDLAGLLNNVGEIPEGGATLFFQTTVKEGGVALEDANLANDIVFTKVYSLLEQAGRAVSLASLTLAEDGWTRVQVEAFNNSMNAIPNGNLTVTLKDDQGNILETRQTYDAADAGSLLSLAGEDSGVATMEFDHTGASAEVLFSRISGASTQLSALKMTGVPIAFHSHVHQYDIQTYDLVETSLTAAAENPASVVSVTRNGSPVSLLQPCALTYGTNAFVVTVTTGETIVSYTVNVRNLRTGGSGSAGNDDETNESYSVRLTLSGQDTSLDVFVDASTGQAVIQLGDLARTLFQNNEAALLDIPAIPGVTSYRLTAPAEAFAGPYGKASLTLRTALGSMVIPSGMLAGMVGIEGKSAGLTLAEGYRTALSGETRAVIGDRPLLEIILTLDGVQTDWNNPNAPVAVRIPYLPAEDERENPESIIIWYIDDTGHAVPVPNGHYDPGTGTVTFRTTHFSTYAVAFHKVSFDDVQAGTWYEDAVHFIAARDITQGTGGRNFSPHVKLTRGDFLVLLMRSQGIEPETNPADNFTDAGNTWYTGYLAAAKARGISKGVGNNLFAPDRAITRQEMFTLLHHALKATDQLPNGESGNAIEAYTDAEQILPWAMEAMTLLVKTGLVRGNNGALMPFHTATRAEMAQVLFNLMGKP